MSISVIISAYKDYCSLDKVLAAYSAQTLMPSEIIIAEDGQSQKIAHLVNKWRLLLKTSLLHVTQEDCGFRKNKILNKAIKVSTGSQLIFTDQDILPRNDFIAMHNKLLKPGYFISGGSHLNIKQSFHEHLNCEDIVNQNIFNKAFLDSNSLLNFSKYRITKSRVLAQILDLITPRNAFLGCNSSAHRSDILKVNGFDEVMQYGGEDLNLGIRLNSVGCKGRRHKYSLVCLHLDHRRSYIDKDLLLENKRHNKITKRKKISEARKSYLSKKWHTCNVFF